MRFLRTPLWPLGIASLTLVLSVGCAQALGLGGYETASGGAGPSAVSSSTSSGASGGGSSVSSGASSAGGGNPAATTGVGGSGGAGGSSAGAGGALASDCWAPGASAWVRTDNPLGQVAGQNVRDPSISPDGLTLHYTAGANDGARQVFVATRANRDAPFVGGAALGTWMGDFRFVAPNPLLSEVFVVFDAGGLGTIARSAESGGNWPSPVSVGTALNTSMKESLGSLTENGQRLFFTRLDGADTLVGPASRIHEAQRNGTAKGASFDVESAIAIPTVSSADYSMCPAISPDGRRLVFATTLGKTVQNPLPFDTLRVWMTERASVASPWQPPAHLAELDGGQFEPCPTSITADGCELWYFYFDFGVGGNINGYARRTPGPAP